MIQRIIYILIFFFYFISFSFAESANVATLSTELSAKAFYSKPEHIISGFDKHSRNCQKNFILARAYRVKKKLKNSLLYYANSCFNNKYNYDLRLFPQPIYSFVASPERKSIFYQDSIYRIASIFYEYNEHLYVLKFTDLIINDRSALYRDSIILRSKSMEKLKRYDDAIEELKKISIIYKDNESQAMIYIRLGALYESAEDYNQAAESYINVIKAESNSWQNRIAAKRLTYLTTVKSIQLNTADKKSSYALSLYDAGEYDKALFYAQDALEKKSDPSTEKILIKILTIKNSPKVKSFLKSKEGFSGYDELLFEHAETLWSKGEKKEAVKFYKKLTASSLTDISDKALSKISIFYAEINNPEFIKYMELYINKFPDEVQCAKFLWIIGRYYLKKSDSIKAIEYFTRGIEKYPDNNYTSYCRFWLSKITPSHYTIKKNEDLLEELTINNPDTYHTLSLLKLQTEKNGIAKLIEQYNEARKNKKMNKMLLYHNLLFLKTGYNSNTLQRLKQLDSSITAPYKAVSDLIKNPVYTSEYKHLFKIIETYFYAGDIESINREINLIPPDDHNAQKDLALALTVHSARHKYYNYSSFYGFKLLNLYNLKENLSLISFDYASILYPYAFQTCVDENSTLFKIKPELILAMMKVESNFKYNAYSPSGASGLMQLMTPTANEISKELGILKYDPVDPCTSIKFGTKYISWLDRYYNGNIEYIVAGYNAGLGNVNKWKRKNSSRDNDFFSEFLPFEETRDYIYKTKKYFIQYDSIYKSVNK